MPTRDAAARGEATSRSITISCSLSSSFPASFACACRTATGSCPAAAAAAAASSLLTSSRTPASRREDAGMLPTDASLLCREPEKQLRSREPTLRGDEATGLVPPHDCLAHAGGAA
eukprot:scaffold118932_cov57-Phaeocystis_antarctica.AAC.2